jgi:hypothetical protein
MKNLKKHQLPTIARLSFSGNLLIEHPLTGEFHWFKANGEYISPLELDYIPSIPADLGEGSMEIPEYVWEMICIPINRLDGSWNQPNMFIARFPTVGNNFRPSPFRNMGLDPKLGKGERKGSNKATNIFGRRFEQCSNPIQFWKGVYYSQPSTWTLTRNNRRG